MLLILAQFMLTTFLSYCVVLSQLTQQFHLLGGICNCSYIIVRYYNNAGVVMIKLTLKSFGVFNA